MLTNSLLELDRDHLIHSVVNWSDHERRGVTVLQSADGVYVTDMEGRTLLDAFSGLWCVNVGYGRQSIVDVAMEQMSRLPYATGYFHFGAEPTIRLAAKLAELAPGDLNHVFFTLGGSDAVDTALRFIRFHANVTGRPGKKHIISLDKGYHGSSTTGAGVTGLAGFHQGFDVPLPFQHKIPAAYPYRHADGADDAALIAASVKALRDKVAEIGGPEQVAAFFAEPIQGSAGVIVPPKGWLTAMREACREMDILFVADEVITGFGRTGTMFGCEYEDVTPDIMTLAKGLTSGYSPMGAVLLSERIYREMRDGAPAGVAIGHGLTYSGHPVSAAVGLEVLRLYTEEGVVANGARVGERFERRLREVIDHPLVGDVRSRGLLAGVELVTSKANKTKPDPSLGLPALLSKIGYDNGLIFRAFNDGVVGFAPPLSCTDDEIDMIIERFKATLDGALNTKEIRDALD